MNLYLIQQDENTDCDTYDSAVVCAENAEQARDTNPLELWDHKHQCYKAALMNWEKAKDALYAAWATSPDNVKVTLIGIAKPGLTHSVICSSFNAG